MNRDYPYITEIYRYLNTHVVQRIKEDKPLKIKEFYWGGGRNTGKTGTIVAFIFQLSLLFPEKRVNAYFIRKQIKNVRETFEQVVSQIPNVLAGRTRTNKTTKVIEFANTRIECLGLVQQASKAKIQRLGKARLPSDIQILFFDEAFQFTATEMFQTRVSIGDPDCKWLIWFGAANPFQPDSWFFKEMFKILPYDKARMKREYDYYAVKGQKLVHWAAPYSCWNEPWMGAEVKRTIERSHELDPITADVVLWGEPLYYGDGIYTGYMHKVNKVNTIPQEFLLGNLFCGIDVGYSNDPTVVIIGIEHEGKVLVYNELIIESSNKMFDGRKKAHQIVEFIKSNIRALRCKRRITVYVDNDFAFADTLNEVSNPQTIRVAREEIRLDDLLSFERISDGYRKTRIRDRIKAVIRCLDRRDFYMINGKGHGLTKEFQLAQWQSDANGITKEIRTRADGNDHSLNALEYGLREKIYSIGSGY